MASLFFFKELRVSWTAEERAAWEARLSEGGPALVPNVLRRAGLPQRLVEALCAHCDVPLQVLLGGSWSRRILRQQLAKLENEAAVRHAGN